MVAERGEAKIKNQRDGMRIHSPTWKSKKQVQQARERLLLYFIPRYANNKLLSFSNGEKKSLVLCVQKKKDKKKEGRKRSQSPFKKKKEDERRVSTVIFFWPVALIRIHTSLSSGLNS
jgi:hypothetical protein